MVARLAGLLALVQVTAVMEVTKNTAKHAAWPKVPTTWYAKTLSGMDGMEHTSRWMVQNIVRASPLEGKWLSGYQFKVSKVRQKM